MRRFMLLVWTVLLTTQVFAQEQVMQPGGLPQGWEEPILNYLRQTAGESVDLEALGIENPGQEVDLYGLYRDNELQRVIRWFGDQHDKESFVDWELPEREAERYDSARPIIAKVNQIVISSLNHIALAALSEACNAEVRPAELVVTAGAGIDFRASFRGEVSLKFNLTTSCPNLPSPLMRISRQPSIGQTEN